jgi:hypothetical protein
VGVGDQGDVGDLFVDDGDGDAVAQPSLEEVCCDGQLCQIENSSSSLGPACILLSSFSGSFSQTRFNA